MEVPTQPGVGPESTDGNSEQQREAKDRIEHVSPSNEIENVLSANEEHEALHRDAPRIYVASLSDYNNGLLHGEWINANSDVEELHTAVNAMLANSPSDPRAEEFAIHDYDNFGHYEVGEYDSLGWIAQVAAGIDQHGPAFTAWASECDHERDKLVQFEDVYRGSWKSIEEYADAVLDDFGLNQELEDATPDLLKGYVHVDMAGFARDMQSSLDITVVHHDEGVWIFEGAS